MIISPTKPDVVALLRRPDALLAFGLGAGLAPVAPGTVGTLAAMPVAVALSALALWVQVAVVDVALLLGVWVCGRTQRWLSVPDHPGIVWDECVGLWVACLALPTGWAWWLAALLLFRWFDICKPGPIGWLDRRLKGGWGIMLDDVAAGVLALAVLQAVSLSGVVS